MRKLVLELLVQTDSELPHRDDDLKHDLDNLLSIARMMMIYMLPTLEW
jgi:hypothetical protein